MIVQILTNPSVYKKLLAEIDEATAAGNLSEMPQYDEVVEHCPYYIACVKEAMRLTPSAPNIFPRIVPQGGLEICGRFVPEGTEVTCNPWLVHRDPNIYGDDADVFKPERWLDLDKAKIYNKYSMGFGYGPRVCLGQDVARMELYKGPLMFLRSFNVEWVDETKRGKYIINGGVSYFEDMNIKISRRDAAA
jgi:cytochrome P450